MIMLLLKLVKANPLTTGLAVVILCLSGALLVKQLQVSKARAEAAEIGAALSASQANLQVCQANRVQLLGAVEAQNKAIKDAGRIAQSRAEGAANRAVEVLKRPSQSYAPGAAPMNEWLASQ